MIKGFPKIFHIGDRHIENLLEGEVEITEKIDGSQFNFAKIGDEVHMRSKGAIVLMEDANKMFNQAKHFVSQIADRMPRGIVFHGEYLQRPRHNTLEYSRVPLGNIMLYGATLHNNTMMDWESLRQWAKFFECETVPLIGKFTNINVDEIIDIAHEVTSKESGLGKANAEGIVVKNYGHETMAGGQIIPLLCGKYVSEAFKETHKVAWKDNNKSPVQLVKEYVRSENRWKKAVQHLRDAGTLEGSPRDIGNLMKEINQDIDAELKEEIKERLWAGFRREILSSATSGFPEWYKEQLMKGTINE